MMFKYKGLANTGRIDTDISARWVYSGQVGVWGPRPHPWVSAEVSVPLKVILASLALYVRGAVSPPSLHNRSESHQNADMAPV